MSIKIINKDCPKCGNKMIVNNGKYGKYLACSNCKYTKDL